MEDLVVAECPSCSEYEEHAVLKASPQSMTIRCLECGQVHATTPPDDKIVSVALVWSHGELTQRDRIDVPRADTIEIGIEFEHLGHRMIVTAIENADHVRRTKTTGADTHTVYAKVFDTVPLKASVNEGDVTKSYSEPVDPDRAVNIGEVIRVEGQLLIVKTLKSDQNRTLHKGFLLARNIRRAFCDRAPHYAKEGKIMSTRRRGAPPGKRAALPGSRVKGPRGR